MTDPYPDSNLPTPSHFLTEPQIESRLKQYPPLKSFFSQSHSSVLFRQRPHLANPIYEIQLAWSFDDRLETYAWVWLDALEGSFIELRWE